MTFSDLSHLSESPYNPTNTQTDNLIELEIERLANNAMRDEIAFPGQTILSILLAAMVAMSLFRLGF